MMNVLPVYGHQAGAEMAHPKFGRGPVGGLVDSALELSDVRHDIVFSIPKIVIPIAALFAITASQQNVKFTIDSCYRLIYISLLGFLFAASGVLAWFDGSLLAFHVLLSVGIIMRAISVLAQHRMHLTSSPKPVIAESS